LWAMENICSQGTNRPCRSFGAFSSPEKQTHFAAARGFARGGCLSRGSKRCPAQVLGFHQMSVRREIIMARAKRGPDFSA